MLNEWVKGWAHSFFPGWPQMYCCNQAGPSGKEREECSTKLPPGFLWSKYSHHFWDFNCFSVCFCKISFLKIETLCPLEVYYRAIYWLGVAVKITFRFSVCMVAYFQASNNCLNIWLPKKIRMSASQAPTEAHLWTCETSSCPQVT